MQTTEILSAVLLFVAGLVFFLFGMNIMSDSLSKLAGGKMEKTLKKMTSNPVSAMALGAGITAIIQSSSAMTVMLVGLVNSGIMTLSQSIGVILGSNIGTTVTAWIVSLQSIDGGASLLLTMLKPKSFSPILALIGIALIMMAKKQKKRDIGTILVAFAVLIFGLEMMGDAIDVVPQATFERMFTTLNNPLVALLIGIVVTAIIQSSSASVGILQTISLAQGSTLTFGMAIPIIFGQNIGTCITALIAAIGANKNGKRVVAVHLATKIIGTIIFMIPYYALSGLLADFFATRINAVEIAIVHTAFNILNTALLLPFTALLEKLAKWIVKEKSTDHPVGYLDELLLATPSVAIVESKRQIVKMAELSRDTLIDAFQMLGNYSDEKAERIEKNEELIDTYEDTLGSYLVKLSACDLSDHDAGEISKLLLSIGDFERLGDHALNILYAAREMNEKGLTFSEQAKLEIAPVIEAMKEIITITVDSFDRSDLELAARVEPLEQVIDGLIATANARHVERLKKGKCTIELGFILADVLNNCQRASDHCSNIAVCLIQTKRDAFETHSYLNKLKTSGSQAFKDAYYYYAAQYVMPEE
ncbi:MAG: Na/Pi cotransporter family protein [Ruminococcaceae bacterium]|nr:Na/Pi cotransporter family protein [Oscillospiraceae bacterium]